MVDKYYIAAPWIQEDRGDGPCWYPPPNTVGSFDMRGTEQPLGFFCVLELPSSGSNYTLLGKGDIRGSIEVSTSMRAFWRDFLGLTTKEMPDSISQLSEMLIKTVYYHGDPDGVKGPYPPTIASDGTLAFFLSGHARPGATFDKNMLHRRKFTGKDDPAFFKIQPHYQNIYQGYIDEEMDAKTEEDAEKIVLARKKVLWNWERELSVPAKDLQPLGINEKTVKPTTTVTDTFPYSNGDLEDSANWDQVDGSMIVASNEVQCDGPYISFPTTYRNTNALSSANHYAQLVQVNQPSANGGGTTGFWGPTIRFAAAAETCYRCTVREEGSLVEAQKIIEGTNSSLTPAASGTWTPAWPNTVKYQADGSTIKVFVNTVEKISTTDTAIAGGLRGGINCHQGVDQGTSSCDDFEAADLAAPSGNPWWYYQRNKMRRAA